MDQRNKKPIKRATTRLACEIARTHPDRFNEAVAAGTYRCAPQTTPGKARSFDVDDIVALRLYQREMDEGRSPGKAAEKACLVRQFMADYPDAPRVFITSTGFKAWDRLVPEFDVMDDQLAINANQKIDVIGCEVINLERERRIVSYSIESEPVIVGGE